MTATLRKQHERQRRKAEGQVALSGWLSASDHAALSQMARDSGMTQAQVVSRLIGMVGAAKGLRRFDHQARDGFEYSDPCWVMTDEDPDVEWVLYSDLTAAVGL